MERQNYRKMHMNEHCSIQCSMNNWIYVSTLTKFEGMYCPCCNKRLSTDANTVLSYLITTHFQNGNKQ